MNHKRDTILLIEDHWLNRLMLTTRLEKTGFIVKSREDGQQLAEFVEEIQPDLILMDLFLPGFDGWTLTRALKASACSASIPIIAVTALAMKGEREIALEAGCDAYVTKPIDYSLLLSHIQNLIEQSRSSVKSF